MKHYLGRRIVLKEKLNSHLSKLTGINKDYYAELKDKDLLSLKSAVSDINNILTLRLTLKAAKWISKQFKLAKSEYNDLLESIDKQKPNTAGFDIVLNSRFKLVAEVKCIVPVNDGFEYGAAQWIGIMEDIIKLKKGKKKVPDTSSFFKFIFLLDIGEKSDKAIYKLLKASKPTSEDEKGIARHEIKIFVELFQPKKANKLKLDKVYVVKLK